ncbi:alpha-D-ribose 1-methylphosphonate 5-triphosphate diphosphatase [Pseudooceanicola nanhaiensis]|uniref:alpha-D-ribose 1-methylphosphonate 5-triphosphate diphosphatase n=1 Tax=Pseudooceanicola nanhaiensis TaxID=375761 RepID=UPI001CD24D76|nr:alpha-D-ribose 1-methylphosphonate 5-triphosphate diphosphatase [Pseudooceanicola nanhaiensis]MCA0921717.1 alpha-D-ribose 1-methylphosphonate 5-triphosphate diphosphatase [Pseudooceanicola nanhaiensis]
MPRDNQRPDQTGTTEQILTNARLVLPDEVIVGHLVIRDGLIAEIGTGGSDAPGALDLDGDMLIPGLIELHTDNLERHMTPRPGVHWPHAAAIAAHDAELAGCGIATVFDAVRVGSIVSGQSKGYRKYAREVTDEIIALRAAGLLKISHRLHVRAETCSETLLEELAEFGPDDRIGIVSLMDHTPGQRQFRDESKFKAYLQGKHGYTDQEFADYSAYLKGLYDRIGAQHEAGAVAAAARFGARLASHDDTTTAQVETSAGHGITMAEFPTTVEAARACHANNIAVIMGAPNIVRGGSHSGNVSAAELAQADLLDILSSDYVPASLLLAATQLADLWGDLPRAIATVTANPARASGLTDRGRLLPGLRADLTRYRPLQGVPTHRGTWVAGTRVA